jgi:hypothetical protein
MPPLNALSFLGRCTAPESCPALVASNLYCAHQRPVPSGRGASNDAWLPRPCCAYQPGCFGAGLIQSPPPPEMLALLARSVAVAKSPVNSPGTPGI